MIHRVGKKVKNEAVCVVTDSVIDGLREISLGNCFVAGTLIHTTNGQIPIESISERDTVLSINPDTNKVEEKKILRIFVTITQVIIEIKFEETEKKCEIVKSTTEHPYWVNGYGWKPASELLIGDEVFSLNGGWLKVAGIYYLNERQTVYNFEVDETHNYFVGNLGILVHNDSWIPADEFVDWLVGEVKQRVRRSLKCQAGKGKHRGQHGKWEGQAANELERITKEMKDVYFPEIIEKLKKEIKRLREHAKGINHK